MTPGEVRFKQAALAYLIYGIVYWFGGLSLQMRGLGPGRSPVVWFVVGAVFVVLFPYLLVRDRPWFDRWALSRRDLARVLTALVAFRAFEVGRIALRGGPAMPTMGGPVPDQVGAWLFFLIALGTAAMLARAAWSRQA